jgi:DNA-binding PadR family transcriptional regulator
MLDVADFAEAQLGPGTLYSAIKCLVEHGWIAPLSAPGRQRPRRITHLAEPPVPVSALHPNES